MRQVNRISRNPGIDEYVELRALRRNPFEVMSSPSFSRRGKMKLLGFVDDYLVRTLDASPCFSTNRPRPGGGFLPILTTAGCVSHGKKRILGLDRQQSLSMLLAYASVLAAGADEQTRIVPAEAEAVGQGKSHRH